MTLLIPVRARRRSRRRLHISMQCQHQLYPSHAYLGLWVSCRVMMYDWSFWVTFCMLRCLSSNVHSFEAAAKNDATPAFLHSGVTVINICPRAPVSWDCPWKTRLWLGTCQRGGTKSTVEELELCSWLVTLLYFGILGVGIGMWRLSRQASVDNRLAYLGWPYLPGCGCCWLLHHG